MDSLGVEVDRLLYRYRLMARLGVDTSGLKEEIQTIVLTAVHEEELAVLEALQEQAALHSLAGDRTTADALHDVASRVKEKSRVVFQALGEKTLSAPRPLVLR